MSHEAHPHTWYTTNLVGVPAPVLGSTAFNAHPVALRIVGARESHAGLFSLLGTCRSSLEASEVFVHYLSLAFGLTADDALHREGQPKPWRSSYVKLLQSWGFDSNGSAGAVLKGWVESRFGLVPCFHKGRLERFPSPAWVQYIEEKACSRFHNNCIHQQLDLLFEYCQWSLQRFRPFGSGQHVPLWRGITRCEEQIVSGELHQASHSLTIRLNNLVSFATSAEQADCFGDWLLRAEVPLSKLLFYPGLLPSAPLSGEGEVLTIGGDFEVEARYA